MSDELLCRNTTYKHICDPRYARKYNGYCLDCANAGVDDRDEEIARLRARIAELEATAGIVLTDWAHIKAGDLHRLAALLEKPQ